MIPPSATDNRVNLVGLASMLAATAWVVRSSVESRVAIVCLMAAVAVPILVLDVAIRKVHRRPTTGLDWSRPGPVAWERIGTRWLGFAASAALPLAFYALTPEYTGDFYDAFRWFLWTFGPPGAVVALAVVAATDRYLVDPRDGAWHLGAALTGRAADGSRIADLLRGTVVKAFFFPLMFTYAVSELPRLVAALDHPDPYFRWWKLAWHGLFLVDVVFTAVGYLLTVRALDTHVRSAEPTMSGWVVALACYEPFYWLLSRAYFFHATGRDWEQVLAPWPTLRAAWGVVILGCVAVYVGATVSFGCRFSNLTHRGIVTNGPYRFTRHPAYVSKCAFWWLMELPFVHHDSVYATVQSTIFLGAQCGLYWLRARTEERHLSADPTYVAYALAMNERSVFAPLGRWFPWLRYQPPGSSG